MQDASKMKETRPFSGLTKMTGRVSSRHVIETAVLRALVGRISCGAVLYHMYHKRNDASGVRNVTFARGIRTMCLDRRHGETLRSAAGFYCSVSFL